MNRGPASRLHIGLVTPGFSAAEDDWCIPALLNLVHRLAEAHDVSVYTLRYPHHSAAYNVFGARVRALGGADKAGLHRVPLLATAIAAIRRDARRKPFSVLHGLWADEAGFVAAAAGRLCRTPALVSMMGGELVRLPQVGYGAQLSRSAPLLINAALRLAQGLSAGSRQLCQEAARTMPRRPISVLPLGVDLSLFHGAVAGASSPSLRIVHTGSLTAVKDQELLLRAFAGARLRLQPRQVALHIAGDGPLRRRLQATAGQLGVDEHVQFHGALRHDDLPAFLRQGQLFVLSSLHESQNLAFLEAAACGLPVAGTAVGLLPELIPSHYLAAPGDATALARCIVELLQDEATRQAEANRLHSLVRSQFGLESTVPALLKVYRQLVMDHPPSGA